MKRSNSRRNSKREIMEIVQVCESACGFVYVLCVPLRREHTSDMRHDIRRELQHKTLQLFVAHITSDMRHEHAFQEQCGASLLPVISDQESLHFRNNAGPDYFL